MPLILISQYNASLQFSRHIKTFFEKKNRVSVYLFTSPSMAMTFLRSEPIFMYVSLRAVTKLDPKKVHSKHVLNEWMNELIKDMEIMQTLNGVCTYFKMLTIS